MTKKVILYFSFICKSFLYILVSFVLRFNFGKKRLLAQKLRLGAAIITLTSVFGSCSGPDESIETTTCYEMVSVDSNYIEMKIDSTLEDSLPNKQDSVGKILPSDRAMCYGAPANLNNKTND